MILATLLLLTGLASPPGIAPTVHAIPGARDVVLSHGQVLTTSIYADTITMPSGATAAYAGSVTLSASAALRIDGQLLGEDDGTPHDITLEGGTIAITGSVAGNHGAHGAPGTGASTATGGNGGYGLVRGGNG